MKVVLFGAEGKVGTVLAGALAAEGHEVTPVEVGDDVALAGHDAIVDFTQPDAVAGNVLAAVEQLERIDAAAKERGVPVFIAPNFAIGAVLMMRFAAQAARFMPRAEIIELHNDTKVDAPSGTAKATAALIGDGTAIHSVRLPGLVAHQEVLFGGPGQTLSIRHDTMSREAFVPGVLLALARLETLPPGLTVGLDALLD